MCSAAGVALVINPTTLSWKSAHEPKAIRVMPKVLIFLLISNIDLGTVANVRFFLKIAIAEGPFLKKKLSKAFGKPLKAFNRLSKAFGKALKPFNGFPKAFGKALKPFNGFPKALGKVLKPFNGLPKAFGKVLKPFNGFSKALDRFLKPSGKPSKALDGGFEGEKKQPAPKGGLPCEKIHLTPYLL